MSMSRDPKLVRLTASRPQTLADVIKVVGATPVDRISQAVPDHLAAAGWEIYGEGFGAARTWRATSPSGEVIHFANGEIQGVSETADDSSVE